MMTDPITRRSSTTVEVMDGTASLYRAFNYVKSAGAPLTDQWMGLPIRPVGEQTGDSSERPALPHDAEGTPIPGMRKTSFGFTGGTEQPGPWDVMPSELGGGHIDEPAAATETHPDESMAIAMDHADTVAWRQPAPQFNGRDGAESIQRWTMEGSSLDLSPGPNGACHRYQ